MQGVLEITVRVLVGFLLLLALTRLLGKKQLGQLTIFTYITAIAMGNIAGDMVVHKDVKLVDGITGLALWAVLTFLVELVSLKSSRARVLLDDEPTVVIKQGEIMQKQLTKLRLNMDDLCMLLRINGVFSMGDVDYAILEPNGQLSILKKPGLDAVAKADLSVPAAARPYIPTEIIVDGKLVEKNMKELRIDRDWLDGQLKKANIQSYSEVFFAEIQSDGSLYISKKEDPPCR